MGYCTIDDLKLFIDTTDISTAQMNTMIDAASKMVDQLTGDTFTKIQTAYLFSGNNRKILLVSPGITKINCMWYLECLRDILFGTDIPQEDPF